MATTCKCFVLFTLLLLLLNRKAFCKKSLLSRSFQRHVTKKSSKHTTNQLKKTNLEVLPNLRQAAPPTSSDPNKEANQLILAHLYGGLGQGIASADSFDYANGLNSKIQQAGGYGIPNGIYSYAFDPKTGMPYMCDPTKPPPGGVSQVISAGTQNPPAATSAQPLQADKAPNSVANNGKNTPGNINQDAITPSGPVKDQNTTHEPTSGNNTPGMRLSPINDMAEHMTNPSTEKAKNDKNYDGVTATPASETTEANLGENKQNDDLMELQSQTTHKGNSDVNNDVSNVANSNASNGAAATSFNNGASSSVNSNGAINDASHSLTHDGSNGDGNKLNNDVTKGVSNGVQNDVNKVANNGVDNDVSHSNDNKVNNEVSNSNKISNDVGHSVSHDVNNHVSNGVSNNNKVINDVSHSVSHDVNNHVSNGVSNSNKVINDVNHSVSHDVNNHVSNGAQTVDTNPVNSGGDTPTPGLTHLSKAQGQSILSSGTVKPTLPAKGLSPVTGTSHSTAPRGTVSRPSNTLTKLANVKKSQTMKRGDVTVKLPEIPPCPDMRNYHWPWNCLEKGQTSVKRECIEALGQLPYATKYRYPSQDQSEYYYDR